MKASKFSDAQKAFILKQGADAGGGHLPAGLESAKPPTSIRRSGMTACCPTEMRRLKQLEDENGKLRKLPR